MVSVGTDLASSRACAQIAAQHDSVWAAAGVHPHETAGFDEAVLDQLVALAAAPRVVAIGEIGLDYYRDRSSSDDQIAAFKSQLAAAKSLDKAVVLHIREAYPQALKILAAEGPPDRLIFHCFSGTPAHAVEALEMGACLSFAGNVSYRSAGELRQTAMGVPLDRLLVETDSPFLTPAPHRGKPNEPSYVIHVGRALADALGVGLEELAGVTTANALRIFKLPEYKSGPD